MVNLKRTREDILISAIDTIHVQGFHATGLKQLLTSSGVSSGSFYNYFQSKDELAHALIDFKWSKLKSTLFKDSGADSIDELWQMIHTLELIHLAEDPCAGCFLGNLIVELVTQDRLFRSHLAQVFEEWQGEIAKRLSAGKSQLKSDINTEHFAQQILTAIEGALLLGRLYDDPDRLRLGFNTVRQLLKAALVNS